MGVHRAGFPGAAALLTVGATAVSVRGGGSVPGSLLVGLVPLAVPTVWAVSFVAWPSLRWHLVAGLLWLLLVAGWVPGGVILTFVAYLFGGLGLGWALLDDWRADGALGITALPLVLVVGWAAAQLPIEQIIAEFGQDLRASVQQAVAANLEESARQVQLAEYEKLIDGLQNLLSKLWPGLIALGLLGNAGVIWLLGRWLGRRVRPGFTGRPVPAFHQWGMPFYLVWVLAVGLLLVAMRQGVWSQAGLNLILVAATLFSIQGLAVQIFLLGRICPPWVRIVFWTAAALFFAPLILVSSAVIGLCDQWLNLRRFAPTAGPPRLG